jgi:hypothetical protein
LITNRRLYNIKVPLTSSHRGFLLASTSLLLCLIWATRVSAQQNPLFLGDLSVIITEASGLQYVHPDTCYTFNDSDDGARIYQLNQDGGFISQTILNNSDHIDYEDIAVAPDGRFFIGDFGNNDNDRQDLRIYIATGIGYQSSVNTQVIDFELSDQIDFPPNVSMLNFDIEAMVFAFDSLYLFTRNRTSPFNGITKMYSLPAEPGVHVAQLRDSFFGNLSSNFSSITGADISTESGTLALLTKGSVFFFPNFTGTLDTGNLTYNFFSISEDFEGISFIDGCTLGLVTEGNPSQLYTLNSCEILTGLQASSAPDSYQVSISQGGIHIETDQVIISAQLLDGLGRVIRQQKDAKEIPIAQLPSGMYTLMLNIKGIVATLSICIL